LKRQFSVKAQEECELLTLGIDDLQRMKFEFCEAYDEMMNSSFIRLVRASKLKLKAMHYCDRFMFTADYDKFEAFQDNSPLRKQKSIFNVGAANDSNEDVIFNPISLKLVDSKEFIISSSDNDEESSYD
jgi:hypothetical protein